ncbi:hypothetical protein NEOLEDRAFT_1087406, partial [Neolentinus lepideus HHB14362 ss-1]
MVRYPAGGLDEIVSRRRGCILPDDAHKLQWFAEEAQMIISNTWDQEDLLSESLSHSHRHQSSLVPVEACNSLSSPIWNLPLELLCKVFWFTLPAGEYVCMRKDSSPLLVAQVCRLWRDVALSTPNLWASITLGGDSSQGLGANWPNTQAVQTWLGRSGQCSLSVKITNSRGKAAAYL